MTTPSEPPYNQEHGEYFDPAAAIQAEKEEKYRADVEWFKQQKKRS